MSKTFALVFLGILAGAIISLILGVLQGHVLYLWASMGLVLCDALLAVGGAAYVVTREGRNGG
jgi:hypothetical protein